jgi:hypothetical protein
MAEEPTPNRISSGKRPPWYSHAGWRWVLAFLAAAGVTLPVDIVRVGCLAAAVGFAMWAIHGQMGGHWLKTLLAGLGFCIVAVLLFVGAHAVENHFHAGNAQSSSSPALQGQKPPEGPAPKQGKAHAAKGTSVSSRGHGVSVGKVEGNCNQIIGGSNNQATANCVNQDKTLTSEQRTQFALHLKEVPSNLVIRLSATNDAKATTYAQSMLDVVTKNHSRYGWEQSALRSQYQGIRLISHPGEGGKVKDLCDWMTSSLGVPVQCSEDKDMPSDVAYIYVDLVPQ